ncbi:reverse transcriptase domain-containing protein [Tanacetum coccineum]
MDDRSRRSFPKHERVHRDIANSYSSNKRRNLSNVPRSLRRKHKRSVVSREREKNRRLRRYFQAYLIQILTDKPIKQILARPEKSRLIAKWRIELREHKTEFRGRNSVKGHTLVDFLAETPSAEDKETEVEETKSKEPGPENACKLFIDGASSSDGSGEGLMLVSPEGKEYTYALRFEFKTTNNEAEYEALLAGQGALRSKAANHITIPGENKGDTQELRQLFHRACPDRSKQEGGRSHHTCHHGNDAYGQYKQRPLSKRYTKAPVECMQSHDLLIYTKKAKAGDDTYNFSMAFLLVGIDIVGPLPIAPGVNGLVEVTNRDIVKGMEQRLGKTHQGWVDELPQVLWTHKTTPKSSNRQTPFSLVYGSEAIVPIEICVKTKQIQDFDVKQNEKRCREDLDILKERREIDSIREAYYKQNLEGYYNNRVRSYTFKPGTYVLQLNSASKVEF